MIRNNIAKTHEITGFLHTMGPVAGLPSEWGPLGREETGVVKQPKTSKKERALIRNDCAVQEKE